MAVELLIGGKRVAVVSSDARRVPAGESVALEAFHEPDAVGAWTARAYVTCDGIRTDPHDEKFDLSNADAAGLAGAKSASGNEQPVAATPVPGAMLVGVVRVLADFARRR